MPFLGQFAPPGDKSISHRLVLMSLLAEGRMHVAGLSVCEDVNASLDIFRALGGSASPEADGLSVVGLGGRWRGPDNLVLDCRNSGTTFRLLMGLLASRPGRFVLDGDSQLRRRPMERVAEPLRLMGASVETQNGKPPVSVVGQALTGIVHQLTDASAQLKGALLLAGLSAAGRTVVVEPAKTRDHTERLINHWGGQVAVDGLRLTLTPGPLTLPPFFAAPGDPSSAAFFLAAAAMIPGSRVTAVNVLLSHGRTGFLRVLDRMGAKVSMTLTSDTPEPVGEVAVAYDGPLSAVEVSASEVPSLIDEIPILALAATQAQGVTIFRQVDELRIKETDRLMSIRHQLGALGARAAVEGDDLIVEGPTSFILPDSLDSGHDHRLAMTLTMALKAAKASIPVLGRESIPVSYPNFDQHLSELWQD
ncbi:MAG: 3-phosphoshikimate 1-carboxyvinyltransferase [Deltaproteobacteria bacterium]|jgi:3-phosphoshikimate 1-carboxyvinyltransferase|nr:3-phosphoshikimate 1-carboxyvinyltransferase [Deltaproteobacteria bacterium]